MPTKKTFDHWMTNDGKDLTKVSTTETAEAFTARQKQGYDDDRSYREENNKVINTDIKEIEEILNGEDELDERAKEILKQNLENLKKRLIKIDEFTFRITNTIETGEIEFK